MVSKEELINIINRLHNETDLLCTMRYGHNYEECNGHLKIEYSYGYKDLYLKLKKEFEDLGYSVKHGGWNYMEIYYTNPTKQLEIFKEFK